MSKQKADFNAQAKRVSDKARRAGRRLVLDWDGSRYLLFRGGTVIVGSSNLDDIESELDVKLPPMKQIGDARPRKTRVKRVTVKK